jgi:hypothetical protein
LNDGFTEKMAQNVKPFAHYINLQQMTRINNEGKQMNGGRHSKVQNK